VWIVLDRVHLNARKAETVIAKLFFCGASSRKNTSAKNAVSIAGRSPLYPLEMTQS